MDAQLAAQLSQQIANLGRQLKGVALGVTQAKERLELLSRMMSMHHFALLALAEDESISLETRKKIEGIAKRFKVKLKPTDPDYKDERDSGGIQGSPSKEGAG